MSDYFDAVVDRRFRTSVDLWAIYERVGSVLLAAAADLGDFTAGAVYLQASDNSVTINRETISEARKALDDSSMEYNYSFYTMNGRLDHRTQFGVYLWVEQNRIMVTLATSSHVLSEGLKSVVGKFLQSAEARVLPAVDSSTPQTGAPIQEQSERPVRRVWYRSKYFLMPLAWVGGLVTVLIGAWLVALFGWN